ncbi:MAG: fibrobacter succinogenes major paralogous domain-containing protein, partial [Bacteroidales bacterium]|nr:fibrobacter succinogenes major paralogous domain-containing protein [Bacteroidales bacterium]
CLYSWGIAMEVCPEGWHLPTDSEWMKLEVFYGIDGKDMISVGMRRSGQVGLKLKGVMFGRGLDHEKNVITNFNAMPSGVYKDGFVDGLNLSAYYWTSTYKGHDTRYYRMITKSSDGIYRYYIAGDIKMSVRCVRNN